MRLLLRTIEATTMTTRDELDDFVDDVCSNEYWTVAYRTPILFIYSLILKTKNKERKLACGNIV